jgi:hypothetical protein
MLDSGRVRARRSRSARSRCRRFMMLCVSWPWNEGPLDLGPLLLFSVDEERAGTARRARHVIAGRRAAAAAAAAGAAKLCPRPLGILPASRDMACIGVSGVQLASDSEREAIWTACRVVGSWCRWSGWASRVPRMELTEKKGQVKLQRCGAPQCRRTGVASGPKTPPPNSSTTDHHLVHIYIGNTKVDYGTLIKFFT